MEIEERDRRLSAGSDSSFRRDFLPTNQKISLESNVSQKFEQSQGLFDRLLNEQNRRSQEEPARPKTSCKCQRSKCLQMYCECFAQGGFCGQECSCVKCKNNERFKEQRQSVVESILRSNPDAFVSKFEVIGDILDEASLAYKKGCRCKKSHCQKKYCQCFLAQLKCSYLCTCDDCLNGKQ